MVVTVLALWGTALLSLVMAVVGWRYRGVPSARLFAALQTVAMLWVVLTVVGLSTPPGPVRLGLWGGTTAMSLLSIALWLAFVLRYTGRGRWLESQGFAAAVLPLVAGAAVYVVAPAWPPLIATVDQTTAPIGTVVEASVGPLGGALGVYIYLVFAVGLVLVGKTALEGTDLFLGQAVALVLGTLVPVVASVGAFVGVPAEGYPTTQVALGGQSLLWGYAVFRQQFLQVVPGVARIGERAVLSDLDDGVVVLGTDGTVVRANAAARAYLGADELVGESVESLLDRIGVESLGALPGRFRDRGRTYQVKASPVTDWRGEEVGHSLVVRDVTDLVRRQERLAVLNRVLRHNLRNSLNVVQGVGAQIQRRSDDELADLGATVVRKAEGLTAISEKAIEVEKILDRPPEMSDVDLPALVADVVEPLAERHPEATVSTDVDVDEVVSDPQLLGVVVEEAVENALTHAGQAPHVRVTASRSGGDVRLVVADDGRGIPESELDAIRSGEETPLRHARGLGLWLVYWGARSLGGDVSFENTDDGARVVVVVPDGRTAAASPPSGTGAGADPDAVATD